MEEKYWSQILKDQPVDTIFSFESDINRKGENQFSTNEFCFQNELSIKLLKICNSNDQLLHVILTSLFSGLRYKYSGATDTILVTPIYRQKREADYINTVLPLRISIDSRESFKDLLLKVKDIVSEAIKNQNFSIKTILLKKQLEKNDINPLQSLHTSLILENIHDVQYLSEVPYKLLFSFKRLNEKIAFSIRFNNDYYSSSTINNLGKHFISFTQNTLKDVNKALKDIPILTEREKRKIIYDFNDAEYSFVKDNTIVSLFEDQIKKLPYGIAVIDNDNFYTYMEVNKKANQFSHQLFHLLNGKKEIVGVVMERSIDLIISLMGILKAGCAYVPLEPNLPIKRIESLINSLGLNIVVTNVADTAIQELLFLKMPNIFRIFDFNSEIIREVQKNSLDKVIRKSEIYLGNEENINLNIQKDDLAYIIFTSGTTGLPKGVMVNHNPVVNVIDWVNKTFNISDRDKILFITSVGFDLSVYDIFGTLAKGAVINLVSGQSIKDPDKLFELLQKESVTIWDSAPAALQQLVLNLNSSIQINRSLRLVMLSGDWIPIDIKSKMEKYFTKMQLVSLGGATEATIWSNFYFINSVDPQWKSIPYGKPIQNAKYYILDDDMNVCPLGVPGNLYIGGECLSTGYINEVDLTNQKFLENPFVSGEMIYMTGDFVKWKDDGNMEILGRKDGQVKVRGFRIELGEIQQQLTQYPAIDQAIVSAIKNGNGENVLFCHYIAKSLLPTKVLKDYLKKTLPDYMIPSFFIKIDCVPVTANGKLDFDSLPREVEAGINIQPASNIIESRLIEIWADVLKVAPNKIGINCNFFEIGGHSILATIFINRVQKEFHIDIRLSQFYRKPTIKSISEFISLIPPKASSNIKIAEKKEYYPLSISQRRVFAFQQLNLSSVHYNMPFAFKIIGQIDKNRLNESINCLIKRHEIFRTAYRLVNGKPVQIINKTSEYEIKFKRDKNLDVKDLFKSFIKPFNLLKAPLIRVLVVEDYEENQFLFIDMHHIASDDMTVKLFVDEFQNLYYQNNLSIKSLNYKDYVVWLDSCPKSLKLKEQEEYWRTQFQNFNPSFVLPTDRISSKKKKEGVFPISKKYSAEKYKEINNYCESIGITFYTLFLGLYSIALSKWSGFEDVFLSTFVANRPHADLQNVMGMFSNTIPIKSNIKDTLEVAKYLKKLNVEVLDLLDNQAMGYEQILAYSNLKENEAKQAISVVYNFQMNDEILIHSDAFKLELIDSGEAASKFNLGFAVNVLSNNIFLSFSYNRDLFLKNTIQKLMDFIYRMCNAIITKHDLLISELCFTAEEDLNLILHSFNNQIQEIDSSLSLDKIFNFRVKSFSDKIAVSYGNDHITYKQLNKRSNYLASIIQKEGAKQGSIVALYLSPSIDLIISILSIVKAGCAFLPINKKISEKKFNSILDDAAVDLIITDAPILNKKCLLIDDVCFDSYPLPLVSNSNDINSICFLIYDSGSIGTLIEHRNLLSYISALNKKYDLNQDERMLYLESQTFTASVEQIFLSLSNCFTLIIPRDDLLGNITKLEYFLDKESITHFNTLSTILSRVNVKKYKSLRRVISGGDVCHANIAKSWFKYFQFYNSYGHDEATIASSMLNLLDLDENRLDLNIGKPLENTQILILDKQLKNLPIGIQGEICISGEGVARGYLNNPELTVEKFIPNSYYTDRLIYKTGEIGKWMDDGAIEFIGRIDEQVIINGIRIELGEIQNVLILHNNIRDAKIIFDKSLLPNNGIIAYFIANKEINNNELRDYISRLLPSYMVPGKFIQVENIPPLTNGKVDSSQPKELILNYTEDNLINDDFILTKIKSVWAQTFGLKLYEVNDESNFFEDGGDSIKAIQFSAALSQESLYLNTNKIYINPVLSELRKEVIYKGNIISQDTVTGKLELAPILLYFYENYGFESHYNMSFMMKKSGRIDHKIIQEIFGKLVLHHDVLRSRFYHRDNRLFHYITNDLEGHVEIIEFDLSEEKNVKKAIQKNIESQVEKINIESGPIALIGIFNTKVESHLFICLHHLVFDAVSMRILTEDFINLYNQIDQNQKLNLPLKTNSYKYWVEQFYNTKFHELFLKEYPFWQKMLAIPSEKIKKDYLITSDKKCMKYVKNESFILTKEFTDILLSKVINNYNTQMHEVLISCFAYALKEYFNLYNYTIDMEGHGRDQFSKDCDISRTIGWFTSLYPFPINTNINNEYQDILFQVQQVANQVPTGGIGYGILKHIILSSHQTDPIFNIQSEFRFNYLGNYTVANQDNSGFESSEFYVDENFNRKMPFNYSLDISGIIYQGQLTVNVGYNCCEYKEQTIKEFLSHLKNCLEHIIGERENKINSDKNMTLLQDEVDNDDLLTILNEYE